MKHMVPFLLSLVLVTCSQVRPGFTSTPCEDKGTVQVVEHWDTGYGFNLIIRFPDTVESWTVDMTFSDEVAQVDSWASIVSTNDHKTFTISNDEWDGSHKANTTELIYYMVTYTDSFHPAHVVSVKILGTELC